ncbi:MAG: hypothetical protein WDN09_01900 [bacterium]
MKETLRTSDFGTGLTELHVYESRNKTSRVILLLKGIYSYHFELDDFKTDLTGLKWDQAFVRYFLEHAHVICVNTSRLADHDQTIFSQREDSFYGKNYSQEVSDVKIAFEKALQILGAKGVQEPIIHLIGKSFGGTVFLGMPEVTSKACSIAMLGSGCGRSKETAKPLLSTLPDEEKLLETIRDYSGFFSLYRGEFDEVVPIESQEKIVKASGAKVTNYVTIRDTDHEFEKINGQDSLEPGILLRKMLLDTILLSEKHRT